MSSIIVFSFIIKSLLVTVSIFKYYKAFQSPWIISFFYKKKKPLTTQLYLSNHFPKFWMFTAFAVYITFVLILLYYSTGVLILVDCMKRFFHFFHVFLCGIFFLNSLEYKTRLVKTSKAIETKHNYQKYKTMKNKKYAFLLKEAS